MAASPRATLDAWPDRIDLRDWYYQPSLAALPDSYSGHFDVTPAWVLDQGQEGACTGFALAAVINFLRRKRGQAGSVSPYMLYSLGRRYDEWPGEAYEGSSARGAIKGWVRHGVCLDKTWGTRAGVRHFTDAAAREALLAPGGAYYRIKPQSVRDMHAALIETGILYATLMVHDGWWKPAGRAIEVRDAATGRRAKLKVVERRGRADDGHAVAIVGYTRQGFVIQNSWGPGWGSGGFALLPYEDFLLHATDVWVAQLGVPVALDLWSEAGARDSAAGLHRASRAIPLADIRPHVIDVANNGELSDSGDYWTTGDDLGRLVNETIPARTAGWARRRILLYLHGGLNGEADAARRIVAMRDVMLENEIYPLHVMWESDFLSSVGDLFKDLFTDAERMAGGGLFDHLADARDRVLELTLARAGGKVWGEMKENAALASRHPRRRGALQILSRLVKTAAPRLAGMGEWELHVVGHSAGCIFAAHALPLLADLGLPLKTVQFLAPAIRIDDFERLILQGVEAGLYPLPSVYLLSDALERGDTVGPYGKSLLYLVSNAFEGRRSQPLLGMANFLAAAVFAERYRALADGRPALVTSTGVPPANEARAIARGASASRSHGGFDNDPLTMNSVLTRILDGKPRRLFEARDLTY